MSHPLITRAAAPALKLKALVERRLDLGAETAFTLVELLVVTMIMGILLEMSVPSYMAVRDNAEQKAALSSVRNAQPAMALWFADNNTYQGATVALLNSRYQLNLDPARFAIPAGDLTPTGFCVQYTEATGTYTAALEGPANSLSVGSAVACP